MSARPHKNPEHHGYGDVAVTRYLALYIAQIGWALLGVYLFSNAYWPSTCRPGNVLEVYACSMRLADNRTVVESVLLTWLWVTPILIALEILRHRKPR